MNNYNLFVFKNYLDMDGDVPKVAERTGLEKHVIYYHVKKAAQYLNSVSDNPVDEELIRLPWVKVRIGYFKELFSSVIGEQQ